MSSDIHGEWQCAVVKNALVDVEVATDAESDLHCGPSLCRQAHCYPQTKVRFKCQAKNLCAVSKRILDRSLAHTLVALSFGLSLGWNFFPRPLLPPEHLPGKAHWT